MFTRTLCALVSIPLILAGCSSTSGPQTNLQNLGGSNFVALGNGRFIAEKGFTDSNEEANYRIKAKFNPGGTLTLVSHSDNSLQGGMVITFERQADRISVQVNGVQVQTFGPKAVADEVELQVENHNGEPHVRITDTVANVAEFKFDSEDTPVAGLEKGKGDKWGLILLDVTPLQIGLGEVAGH